MLNIDLLKDYHYQQFIDYIDKLERREDPYNSNIIWWFSNNQWYFYYDKKRKNFFILKRIIVSDLQTFLSPKHLIKYFKKTYSDFDSTNIKLRGVSVFTNKNMNLEKLLNRHIRNNWEKL